MAAGNENSSASDNGTSNQTQAELDAYVKRVIGGSVPLHPSINFDELPKPRFTSTKVLKGLLLTRLLFATSQVDRPLLEDENIAIAQSTATFLRTSEIGPAIGSAAGAYQWFATMKDFKFPLVSTTGKRSFDPNRFAFLEGPRARLCWHSLRLSFYLSLGASIGYVFFGSYATATTVTRDRRDPRLKEIVEAENNAMKLAKERRESRGLPGQADAPMEVPKTRRPGDVFRMYIAGVRAAESGMSDQGRRELSNFEDLAQNENDEVAYEGGNTWIEGSQNRPSSGTTLPTAGISRVNKQESASQSDNFSDSFDGASPTAGNEPVTGGSAWDRLRQQAGSREPLNASKRSPLTHKPRENVWQKNRGATAEQPEQESSYDSFSFSKSEEERQLAKEEAQREFDERVERERRGGDFNEEKENRRWR